MTKKVAILSRNPALYSTSRLVEAGRARGADMVVIDPLHCVVNLSKKKPEVDYHGRAVTHVDAVIPRIGASITFYGLAVLRQFEMMGVFAANESQAVARSRDKLRSLQLFSRHDIGIPKTTFARRPEDLADAIRRVGGAPVVLKLLEGTQGVGVILAESVSSARSVVEAIHSLNQNILIQAFIKEAKGQDIRAIVVGDQVVAAMRRTAVAGEFRSNVHRGGTTVSEVLDDETRKTALEAARVLGLNIAGVDLMPSNDGPMVLEVNSSPGLRGIESTTGIDVAGAMLDYVLAHTEGSRRSARIHSDGPGGGA
ncbi:MAG: 30S ribosomal protein S6--L-glutamate ligase [Thermoanaerobaculia bacterium]|nr:30S ribosomal protein S6--L-glutamate ligase [Thermoanaerobaculia bacterium]